MGRRVHNSQGVPTDPTATPDMRLKSYPEELGFRIRRFFRGESVVLLVLLLSMVMARSTDQVLYYRMSRLYANYIWYLSTVVLPLAYLSITLPILFYKVMISKEIPMEQIRPRIEHQKYYAAGGALDTIFNLTSSWPVPYLAGPLVNTLANAVLPMNMVMSVFILRVKYKFTHYVGAALVIYGIMVQLLPDLFLHHNDAGGNNQTVWIIVLILSSLPAALSNIVKEGSLKALDLNEWVMNVYVSVYQLFFGLLTAPTVAIPFPAPAPVISLSELPEYCSRANKCFFGHNSLPTDDCHGMATVFVIFIVFNLTYNQLSLVIFKRGSSVLFTIASALRLPVVDLLLLSNFIAGPASVDKLSVYTYYAVFALILGIATYYHEKEVRPVTPDPKSDNDYAEVTPIVHSPHVGQGKMRTGVAPPNLSSRAAGEAALDEPLLHEGSGQYGSYDGPSLEL